MSYKSILTILSDPQAVQSTLDACATVAQRFDAHLEVLCLGIDHTQTGFYYAGASAVIFQETLARAESEAEALAEAVRARLGRETLRWSTDTAVAQLGSIATLVALRARFCDLVVLPKPSGHDTAGDAEAVVEAALFDGMAPVLIVPDSGLRADQGRKVVIAWNQSTEALVAIRRALPLLKQADSVNIAIIDPPRQGAERSDPGGQLGQWLARHGVRCEVAVLARTESKISDIILRHARDVDADMIVMGAYGHSRLRQAILGGATRNMLEVAELPVLMSH